MKKGIMTWMLLALGSLAIAQQGPPADLTPEEKAEARTKKMMEKGLLDSSAYESAYFIHLEGAIALDALRAEHRQVRDKMDEEKRTIREDKEAALKALMSDEQQAAFELQKAKRLLHQEERALRQKKHHLKKVEMTKEYLKEAAEG